ncbi:unnamed protein product [Arabis nemorensis]|uniref:CCHC-type domain-containing protein n=1 Tax=Arabis nemorensis TaxID=586526 RepID=A0A565ALN6_9BRAS|nr:unnamed protein product [Arabis nemorensis]
MVDGGSTHRFRGCFYCGKKGHRWQQCFKRKKKLLMIWNSKMCSIEPTKYVCVWVTKKDLYDKKPASVGTDIVNKHESGCPEKLCVRQFCRENATARDNEWSLVDHKEVKYITQNNIWNLITCSSDHGSTGRKGSANISRGDYKKDIFMSHNSLLMEKRKQWVVKLLLTQLSMELKCEMCTCKNTDSG